MEYTGTNDFTSSVPIFNLDGSFSGDYVHRDFGEFQKNNKLYQIICNPQDDTRGLLCTFEKENNGNRIESYLNVIAENYLESLNRTRATIVDSDYNIVHYYFGDISSLHLSWILYRNYDEEDPSYDYFALETRVWANPGGNYGITKITAEHDLFFTTDSFIDSGPESDSSAGTVTFSLEASGEGTKGSISYSYELGSAPKIVRDTSNYPNKISWTVTPRLFGPDLSNDVLKFASSWASVQTRKKVRVIVDYSSSTQGNVMGGGMTIQSGLQSEYIEFIY